MSESLSSASCVDYCTKACCLHGVTDCHGSENCLKTQDAGNVVQRKDILWLCFFIAAQIAQVGWPIITDLFRYDISSCLRINFAVAFVSSLLHYSVGTMYICVLPVLVISPVRKYCSSWHISIQVLSVLWMYCLYRCTIGTFSIGSCTVRTFLIGSCHSTQCSQLQKSVPGILSPSFSFSLINYANKVVSGISWIFGYDNEP